ncbi:MAG: glycosyltransferase family 39 protein [Verrucomicrobia bacterium]|nr:glycosyltransferase family 39 protein [Verrucomicrobiota bacterium]
MLHSFLACLLLVAGVVLGLGAPFVARLVLTPAEKLVAGVALSLLGTFLLSWTLYVSDLPNGGPWLLPVLGAAGLVLGRTTLREWWQDADARALLLGQALVTGWCLGWMATIASYSGGGWAGDWFEHWERARFFLERWPLDHKFVAAYGLGARPPLVNVVTGAFLHATRVDYAHYQLMTALLSTLAFLPAALLARRWGGPRAIAVLAVLVMVNPLFVQNSTFAWTKLPTAFFVLAALAFFLRARDADAPPAAAPLFGASLAAGVLAHYSAGPYAVALAGAWLALCWARRREAPWWRATAFATLAGFAVLALWFGWALTRLGPHATFLSNTSVTTSDARPLHQLVTIGLNLRDTLVPHFLRPLDQSLLTQRSLWGAWRDWLFQSYQLNLLLAFGSVAWLPLACILWQRGRAAPRASRLFWGWFSLVVVVLGVATHGARDHWGLAHICLQAFVLLGLAVLAARWPELSRPWKLAAIAGAITDVALGIILHFGVQNYAFDRWFAAGRSPDDTLRSYSGPAFMNLAGKINNRLDFFPDVYAPPLALVLVVLATCLGLALWRVRRTAAP